MQNINPDKTGTPIYLKAEGEKDWPMHKMFYLLTKDGLFLCRNHLWFRSCVPANRGPGELGGQTSLCELSYPRIPRMLMEQAVGFFSRIYSEKHWESALILVFNKTTGQIELLCPEQKANWGTVKYEIPVLPTHLLLIGDLHSHGNMSPDPSTLDEDDELKRPGLHIVVGHITDEPPKFYCAAVVDGTRFEVKDIATVIEGYNQRVHPDDTDPEWLAKIKEHKYEHTGGGYSRLGNWHDGGLGYSGRSGYVEPKDKEPTVDDARIIRNIEARFLKGAICPRYEEVRIELFMGTKSVSYVKSEQLAKKFIKNWDKLKTKHDEKLIGKE